MPTPMPRTLNFATVMLISTAAPALAATGPSGIITDVSVNTTTQNVTAEIVADLGFPLGERRAIVTLACATGKVTVQGITRDDFSFNDETTPDPEAGKGLLDAKVVQTGNSVITIRTAEGPLRFTCRDKLVITDLSGFNDARNNATLKTGMSSNVGLYQYRGMFPNAITIPAVTFLSSEGTPINSSISLKTVGPNIPGSTLVGGFSLDNYAHEKGQGIFLYDAKANTLAPLRYDGNDAGLSKYQSVKIPQGSQVVFYYASDYTKSTGWQKIVFDLKTMQAWSLPTSKPANAKFLQ